MGQRQLTGQLPAWLAGLLLLVGMGLAGPGVGRAEPAAGAGEPGASGPMALDPVVVTAPRVASPWHQVPAAVSVVGEEEIELGRPGIGLDESLATVPGVFATNRYNFAQGLRLSIRGFGARSAFGIRGVRVLLDGIPLTLPDGQSQTDAIDLDSIARMEVLRGPSSAFYGNASGGVLAITTEDGPPEPFAAVRTTNGEFGLWKMQLKSGGQVGPLNYLVSARRLEFGGFRDHSRAENAVVNSKFRLDIDEVSELSVLVNALHFPLAEDPGGLTREQVEADPTQAAALNLEFDTREDIDQVLLGAVYRRQLRPLHSLEARGYYIGRDLKNAVPFRFVDYDRWVAGGGLQYGYEAELLGRRNRLVFGVDVEHQDDHRTNFDNVGGQPGDLILLLQDERVTSVGPYAQEDFHLLDSLGLFAGGRYDWVRFDVDDLLLADGDDSGSRAFDQLTGRFGLTYSFGPEANLYANVSQSFETPTTTELVNRPEGGGGLNPDVEPQKAINYEVGLKGKARRLLYELALYYISLDDELIAFRGEEDRVFFRNAGESRRVGLELGATLDIADGLQARLAYTYFEATFEEFVKDGVDLAGNEVPGLPSQQLYGELFYQHPWGLYTGLEVLYVGEFFADDENTAVNDASAVANLRLGWEADFGPWRLSPFFGVQNLFDVSYNGNVRINVKGGRYFEPAPGVNVYGGLGAAYSFEAF